MDNASEGVVEAFVMENLPMLTTAFLNARAGPKGKWFQAALYFYVSYSPKRNPA
jgi:hypothetical protein